MGAQQGGTIAAGVELLSGVRFQEELRRIARYRIAPPIGDPLDAVVRRVGQNPAFTQSRLLARVLTALTYDQGEFRRAELATFDSDTLAMVIALMDAHVAGLFPRGEWERAADAARASVLEIQ